MLKDCLIILRHYVVVVIKLVQTWTKAFLDAVEWKLIIIFHLHFHSIPIFTIKQTMLFHTFICMIRQDILWFEHDMAWHDLTRDDMILLNHDMAWFDMTGFHCIWSWHDMIWREMIWHDTISDMTKIWHDMI